MGGRQEELGRGGGEEGSTNTNDIWGKKRRNSGTQEANQNIFL